MMDVNLTSPITGDIKLIQDWWIPFINAGIGLFSAAIGAVIVLVANYLQQKRDNEKVKREERKKAYIDTIALLKLSKEHIDPTYWYRISTAFAEVRLLGSSQVVNQLNKFMSFNERDSEESKEAYKNLVSMMTEELQ